MDAASASEARLKGAMQNIAEGNGTPIDAAKIMRESAMSSEDMVAQGMPKSGAICKGCTLAKLPDELFNQVARGDMTIDIGAAISGSGAKSRCVIWRQLPSARSGQPPRLQKRQALLALRKSNQSTIPTPWGCWL